MGNCLTSQKTQQAKAEREEQERINASAPLQLIITGPALEDEKEVILDCREEHAVLWVKEALLRLNHVSLVPEDCCIKFGGTLLQDTHILKPLGIETGATLSVSEVPPISVTVTKHGSSESTMLYIRARFTSLDVIEILVASGFTTAEHREAELRVSGAEAPFGPHVCLGSLPGLGDKKIHLGAPRSSATPMAGGVGTS